MLGCFQDQISLHGKAAIQKTLLCFIPKEIYPFVFAFCQLGVENIEMFLTG